MYDETYGVIAALGGAACGAGVVGAAPAPFAHPVAALPVVDVDPLGADAGVAVAADVADDCCCRLLGDEYTMPQPL